MKEQKKLRVAVVSLILVVALMSIAFCGYQLYQAHQVYSEGEASYEALRNQVVTQQTQALESGTSALVAIPDRQIDFDSLKSINPDTIAWLYSPDTPIDYPVVRASEYEWYLHHLLDGTYNANGTLFLDYNCKDDFSSKLSVIYGHSMQSGMMFGTLLNYKQQSYFNEHPSLYLYTEQQNYQIDLMYGCIVGEGQWRERAFMFEQNLDTLLAYAETNSTFISDVEHSAKDRLIVLSTCSYEFDDARYFVIGVLRPESA